jgi:hypothetical protein
VIVTIYSRIKRWLNSKKSKSKKEYEEEKTEFEMAIGKPFITIKVDMPEGFENMRSRFLDLENDTQFVEEVTDLVKKRLEYEKRGIKPQS